MSKPKVRSPRIVFGEFPGCCRNWVLFDFDRGIAGRRPLTDEEWYSALIEAFDIEFYITAGREPEDAVGTVFFAHSSKENKGLCTPAKFAGWLEQKGEYIESLTWRHITSYMWSPSAKFWKDFENYEKNKAEQEANAEQRGARAA